LYVIAESIAKPGNLGSIVRSADGVGANAVIVCDPRTDIFDQGRAGQHGYTFQRADSGEFDAPGSCVVS
jgi:hypothetical protein